MKRPTRINSKSHCLIPRKAITGLMLSMAILTIFSFISIELKRILWLRSIKRGKGAEGTEERYLVSANVSAHLSNDISLFDTVRIKGNRKGQFMEDIFSDEPQCIGRIFLMILVTSAPDNLEQREVIRKTWADTNKKNPWNPWTGGLETRTIFLVGKSTNRSHNIQLMRENAKSGDVLLGNYVDSFHNQTAKVIHGLTWALSRCRPSYTLKADDECFVNTHLLLHFLWRRNPLHRGLYAGRVRWASPVVRDPNSRRFVAAGDFAAARFPPHAAGAGFVLSLDVLALFAAQAPALRAFPNEDAFVGAVLAASEVRPTYSARFALRPGPWQVCNFLYLFVVHRVKPARMRDFQKQAEEAFEKCSKAEMANDWV